MSNRRGGSRLGSGRKCIKNGKNKRLQLKISQEAYDILDWYSMKIGISRSDLLELWIEDNCSEMKKGV